MVSYLVTSVADLAVALTFESKAHLFLVSSAVLRVVSPVWRKALDPDSGFAPLTTILVGKKEYRKTTIEGIDAVSLLIVFNIFHHRNGQIPHSITFESLRSIAILADQYDFVGALSPWTGFWVDALIPDYSVKTSKHEDWLFISNVFAEIPKCHEILENVSKRLIKELEVPTRSGTNPETNPRYSRCFGSELINLELVPERILAFILKERADRLSKAVLPIWDFTQSMMKFSSHYPYIETGVSCRNPDCFALALGSLLRSITNHRLQGVLLSVEFKLPESSLREAISAINGLRMTTLVLEREPKAEDADSVVTNPTHNTGEKPSHGRLKTLVADLPEDVFLQNHRDSTEKHVDGRFETCPLARHLVALQEAATALLEDVSGYNSNK